MRTVIEYMQLCHIHLYQKIARKKVARVNADLNGGLGGSPCRWAIIWFFEKKITTSTPFESYFARF